MPGAVNKLRPQNGAPSPAPTPGRFAAEVLGARVFVEVTVPRTSVRGSMRLLTRAEARLIRVQARRFVEAEIGVTGPAAEAMIELHEEIATRTVAIAVRDPANRDIELADLSSWEACDDDQISQLFERYQDLEAELDPIGTSSVTEEEVLAIREAAKKKDEILLRSYGSRRLARFAITSVEPPAS